MSFEDPTLKSGDRPEPNERQRELDIDLIRRGASYEITSVPSDLAEELIKEERGELFPDLASYIRLNKVIACPKEAFDEMSAEDLKDAIGVVNWCNGRDWYFIDKDGNVAMVKIDYEKINSLGKTPTFTSIMKELQASGFREDETIRSTMFHVADQYQRQLAIKQTQEVTDKFDF